MADTLYVVVRRGTVVGGRHETMAAALAAGEAVAATLAKDDHRNCVEIEMQRTLSSGRIVYLRRAGGTWTSDWFEKIEERRPDWPWLKWKGDTW